MNNINSGYSGYSMSNRAIEAYESGERPLSKWTKTELLQEAKEIAEANEYQLPARLYKLTADELRKELLYRSSWHHTSSYVNRTDFYSIDEDALESLTDKRIEEIIAARSPRAAREDDTGRRARCKYLEWGGTRRHPTATEREAVGTIKGNWFYLDDGRKKKTTAKGFYIIEYIDEWRDAE